jgi:hypothetical protein
LKRGRLSRLVAAPLAALAIAACSPMNQGETAQKPEEDAANVVKVEGSDLKAITLTAHAAQRLGIVTQPVRELQAPEGSPPSRALALAGIVYDAQGDAWVYAVTRPLTYVRQPLKVSRVQGDLAVFESGPAVGTPVVTVGAAELFGTEFGVGGG